MAEASEAERVAEARARITEMAPAAAIARRGAGDALFLDVRELNEWNLFRIPGRGARPLRRRSRRAAGARCRATAT